MADTYRITSHGKLLINHTAGMTVGVYKHTARSITRNRKRSNRNDLMLETAEV